ncbi:hypothetical protein D3C83_115800 [compost metagenome]
MTNSWDTSEPRSIICGCKRQTPTKFAPNSIAFALIRAVIAAGSSTVKREAFTGPSRNGANLTQLAR